MPAVASGAGDGVEVFISRSWHYQVHAHRPWASEFDIAPDSRRVSRAVIAGFDTLISESFRSWGTDRKVAGAVVGIDSVASLDRRRT